MNSDIKTDITIVIRSSNERTVKLCANLIMNQGVPRNNIFIINEVPFSAAMRKGYQIGIDQERKWTYCIDADVLLSEGSIKSMLQLANEQPEDVFTLSGYVADKLFGFPRAAGNHLFRTDMLGKLILKVKDFDNEGIRPESDAKESLKREGFKELKSDKIIGLHDFEQFYFDIARKAFVHANKHSEFTGEFVNYWKNNIDDLDFKAALIGFSAGLVQFSEVKIDLKQFEGLKKVLFTKLQEKSDHPDSLQLKNNEDIERILQYSQFKMNRKGEEIPDFSTIYKQFKKRLKKTWIDFT